MPFVLPSIVHSLHSVHFITRKPGHHCRHIKARKFSKVTAININLYNEQVIFIYLKRHSHRFSKLSWGFILIFSKYITII
uniref:FLYWCH-type domain-containing protein n=1 Tax=Heterorhabditis bacteriophora TaxID=37862 RepID=A0A1I7WAY1_HETBA